MGKLQSLLGKNPAELRKRLKQLELLSLLRGKNIQEQVVKEEQNMPVTIDITQDLRYKQGVEKGIDKGMEKGIEKGTEKIAVTMLTDGMAIPVVHKFTGLDISTLENLMLQINKDKHNYPKSN